MFNLKAMEKLLPPNAPLTGRWFRYQCLRCQNEFTLDLRVYHSLPYKIAKALGAAQLACPECGNTSLEQDVRMIVS